MATSSYKSSDTTKGRYAAPALTVYGSVRDLTGGTSISGVSDGGSGMAMTASDAAYKENLVQVGEHPAGFGLYLFDYKAEHREALGHGRQFGVIAQEVETIVPEAVVVNADGYRHVNYALLGITRH